MAIKYKHSIEPAGDFAVLDNKFTKGGFFSVKTLTQLYQIKQEYLIHTQGGIFTSRGIE